MAVLAMTSSTAVVAMITLSGTLAMTLFLAVQVMIFLMVVRGTMWPITAVLPVVLPYDRLELFSKEVAAQINCSKWKLHCQRQS